MIVLLVEILVLDLGILVRVADGLREKRKRLKWRNKSRLVRFLLIKVEEVGDKPNSGRVCGISLKFLYLSVIVSV